MNRAELEKYIYEKYGAKGEKLWAKYPGYAAFRHKDSKKWFAILMDIPQSKLGVTPSPESKPTILNILDVKCAPTLADSFLKESGFFPAYHMNKNSWISIDIEQADDDKIKLLLDMSYGLTAKKTDKKLVARYFND